MGMFRSLLVGAVAGAAGTVALDVATYADMLWRGRPASEVPARTAARVAERAGIDLALQDGASAEQVKNRQSGLGALLGYGTGLGVGTLYGMVRPILGNIPTPVAGVLLGAAAMAASDVPSAALGSTNPREWTAESWAADIVPHLVYGLVTAAAYNAFANDSLRH
jgi:hypothetical protein